MRSTFFVFVSTSLQVNEIAQYLLSDVRAFLRMELQRVEIIFLQGRGKRQQIIAGSNSIWTHLAVVTVYKIHITILRNTCKQRRFQVVYRIPAHLWNLEFRSV